MAEFSYKYIEQPALAWGRRLEAQAKQRARPRKATSIEVRQASSPALAEYHARPQVAYHAVADAMTQRQ